jgi:predicted kinase
MSRNIRKKKSKLYLMCGFVGAEKTTLAKKLEKQNHAIRFSTDEWMIGLFNFKGDFGPSYIEAKKQCKTFIWELSKKLLLSGHDVVLDFGFLSKKERTLFRKRAQQIGTEPVLYYLNVPIEELKKRVVARNKKLPSGTFHITDQWFNDWLSKFEVPGKREKPLVIGHKIDSLCSLRPKFKF